MLCAESLISGAKGFRYCFLNTLLERSANPVLPEKRGIDILTNEYIGINKIL